MKSNKRLIEIQKKLLSLFNDLLETIYNETVNESNSSTKNKTVNRSNTSTKNETVNKNKTVNEYNSSTKNKSNSSTKNESKSDYESDYESDNEGDNENKKDKNYYEIKQLNNWFKTIGQTKSLDEQIEILKTNNFLYQYWSLKYYDNNNDLNYKIFKVKAAHLVNEFDEQLFKKVFVHAFAELVEKLISTVDKKENQTIVKDIKNNRSKLFTEYTFDKDVNKHTGDLDDAVKVILYFFLYFLYIKILESKNGSNIN